MNSYDDTKKMLDTIRKIQSMPKYGIIKEQEEVIAQKPQQTQQPQASQNVESNKDEDFTVINGVEIEIHSEDSMDLDVTEDEKGKISQLIDDFRKEVSETSEFDKLHIYSDSAKLDGKIGGIELAFTLSTGDDTGLYISNPSLLKIDENSLTIINKLKAFEDKFSNTINDLLLSRKEN